MKEGPFGFGNRVLISSHRKLLRSKPRWRALRKRRDKILHLSRFSAGLPLLIPTDRVAPSYQLLVLSLASLAFVLFVAITDVLTFGARTEVRSFLDINSIAGRQANARVLRHDESRKVPVAVEFSRKSLASNQFSGE